MPLHLGAHAVTIQAPCSAHIWHTTPPWLFRHLQTIQGMFWHQSMERLHPGIFAAAPKGKALPRLPWDISLTPTPHSTAEKQL